MSEKRSECYIRALQPTLMAQHVRAMTSEKKDNPYWRANVRLITVLMVIWFCFGLLFPIILKEPLDELASLGGFPLGFWFAQQGYIIGFFGLVVAYAFLMRRLEHKYKLDEDLNEEGV